MVYWHKQCLGLPEVHEQKNSRSSMYSNYFKIKQLTCSCVIFPTFTKTFLAQKTCLLSIKEINGMLFLFCIKVVVTLKELKYIYA